MEDSKSSFGSYELPTGLMYENQELKMVEFREMAGPEEDVLAAKNLSVSRKLTTIMSNCLQRIGHIEDRQEITKLVNKMLITDRIMLLVKLRILSLGPIISFTSKCPDCGKEDKKDYDLNDVVCTNPPKANALFKEVTLPKCGKKVRIFAANTKTEEVIEKAKDNAPTMALFARVESFDEKPVMQADIKSLVMVDRNKLRQAIDELEGDIDDSLQMECPTCGHEYEDSLPINGADFFGL